MKRNFKNLNEQISRMKSLFTEERLYGNLIENQNILNEQFRKVGEFVDDVLKKLQKSGITKIPKAVELRNADDLIRFFSNNKNLWKSLGWPVDAVEGIISNILKSKSFDPFNKYNGRYIFEYIPPEGNLRHTVLQIHRENIGDATFFNQLKKITDDVDAKTGKGKGEEFITKSDILPDTPTGYKPKIEPEKPKEIEGGKTNDIDAEDVDYVEIKDIDDVNKKIEAGNLKEDISNETDISDLDEDVIFGTEENWQKLEDLLKEKEKEVIEAAKAAGGGAKLKISIEAEGDEGVKAARDILSNGVKQSNEQVAEEVAEEAAKKAAEEAAKRAAEEAAEEAAKRAAEEAAKNNGFIKKLFTEYPTRFWLNPTTVFPFKEKFDPVVSAVDRAADFQRRGVAGLIRLHLWIITYSVYEATTEDKKFVRTLAKNFTTVWTTILDGLSFGLLNASEDTIEGICLSVEENYLKDKEFCGSMPDKIKNKLIEKKNSLKGEPDKNWCKKYKEKGSDVILTDIVNESRDEVEAEVKKTLGSKLPKDSEKLLDFNKYLEKLIVLYLGKEKSLETSVDEVYVEINRRKEACLKLDEEEKEAASKGLKLEEVVVDVVVPTDIDKKIEKEIDKGNQNKDNQGDQNKGEVDLGY